MPLIELPTIIFACWTLAYQAVLGAGLPAIYTSGLFALLVVPSLVFYVKLRPVGVSADNGDGSKVPIAFAAVLVMGAIVAYLSMLVSRPDWDDLGFFHRAVVQYGHLDAPFFRVDTMHNLPGLPVAAPVQLLTSYEMASVFAARLTGMDPVVFYHDIACAAAAFLVPVVYFLLYRETGLDGPKAFIASLGSVIFLWFDGNVHHSFGNMSFVRLYQGKAVFFTLLIPLMFLYVVKYIKDPRPYNWTMLLLASICGVGLTSSALFMAPAFIFVLSVAWAADHICQGRSGRPGFIKEFFILNFAGIYCIILLLLHTGSMRYYLVFGEKEAAGWWASVRTVLGGGWSILWYGLLLFAVPWFALERRWARFLCLYMVALAVVFFNPLMGTLWANVLMVYSRFVYLLPLPFCAGLGAALVVSLFGRARDRRGFLAAYALLVLLVFFAAMAYNKPTFSMLNYVYYKDPLGYKFDKHVLGFCKEVKGRLGGKNLLAPEEVAVMAPLLDGTLRLEATRELYTVLTFANAGDRDEGLRRMQAEVFVDKGPESPGDMAAFDASIRHGVDAVVTRRCLAPVVLQELSRLPGVWRLAYMDENFALLLKG